jgi:hypothetical protein
MFLYFNCVPYRSGTLSIPLDAVSTTVFQWNELHACRWEHETYAHLQNRRLWQINDDHGPNLSQN